MSPRWALASYSCILGKFEISSEVEKTFNWDLLVERPSSEDDDDESSTKSQRVNVVSIFKYPQVRIFKTSVWMGVMRLVNLIFIYFPDKIQALLVLGWCCTIGIGNAIGIWWNSNISVPERQTNWQWYQYMHLSRLVYRRWYANLSIFFLFVWISFSNFFKIFFISQMNQQGQIT